MFSKTNKTKKSFIGAIAMSLILLMCSALGFLIETRVGQITQPAAMDSWANHKDTSMSGTATQANPLVIKTAGNLAALDIFKAFTTIYVKLDADLDLGAYEWEPINFGSDTTVHFEGNGHTISNLKINKPNENHVGLFTDKEESELTLNMKNVNFSNVSIFANGHAAVVSNRTYGTIENVYVLSGEVAVNEMYAAGIVGVICPTGQILNCTNNADIMWSGNFTDWSSGWNIGGITGNVDLGAKVENCINTGNISGKGNVGGIATQNRGTINNCYVECDITINAPQSNLGDVSRIGGISGSSYSKISNSGFRGNIQILNTLTEGTNNAKCGAIVGWGDTNPQIENCYGIASIRLVDKDNVPNISVLGAPEDSAFKSTYIYTKIITSDGIKESRKYKVGADETSPFSGFAYHENINNGYPFPRSLFAIGQFIECDTMAYLQSYSFDS